VGGNFEKKKETLILSLSHQAGSPPHHPEAFFFFPPVPTAAHHFRFHTISPSLSPSPQPKTKTNPSRPLVLPRADWEEDQPSFSFLLPHPLFPASSPIPEQPPLHSPISPSLSPSPLSRLRESDQDQREAAPSLWQNRIPSLSHFHRQVSPSFGPQRRPNSSSTVPLLSQPTCRPPSPGRHHRSARLLPPEAKSAPQQLLPMHDCTCSSSLQHSFLSRQICRLKKERTTRPEQSNRFENGSAQKKN